MPEAPYSQKPACYPMSTILRDCMSKRRRLVNGNGFGGKNTARCHLMLLLVVTLVKNLTESYNQTQQIVIRAISLHQKGHAQSSCVHTHKRLNAANDYSQGGISPKCVWKCAELSASNSQALAGTFSSCSSSGCYSSHVLRSGWASVVKMTSLNGNVSSGEPPPLLNEIRIGINYTK
jgi:hypothetical protein